jgi:hypothetical protein
MTTQQLTNSINRSPWRRGFVLVTLLLACLTLSSSASAEPTSTKWTQIGKGIINPGTIPDTPSVHHHMCGRIIQAAWRFDNLQNRHVLWMGTAWGGLWKSVYSNGNVKKWIPITDNFPGAHGMGSFIVNKTDSNKILIGPGGFSSGAGDEAIDGKIYRTNDQGGIWYGHPLPVSTGEKTPTHINRIVEDRSDPTGNTVFACTSQGIYRSADFGSVNSWVRVHPVPANLFNLAEVTDIVQDTGNPKIWYAGELTGSTPLGNFPIVRSTDGGISWSPYAPSGSQQITGSVGRISLAACAANPNVLYALVITDGTGPSDKGGALNGVYRTLDRGKNWTKIYWKNDTINWAFEGLHTAAIGCDPDNPDHIFFGLQEPLETNNATALPGVIAWRRIDPEKNQSVLDGGHHDYNFILFRRGFSNIVIANDGGYYTYTPTPFGSLLDDSGNLLGINAMWLTKGQGRFTSSHSHPAEFAAGLQDNGLVRGDATSDAITLMAGGDGGQVSISPDSGDILAVTSTGINTGDNRAISFDLGQNWWPITKSLDDDHYSTVLIDPTPGAKLSKIFTYSQLPDVDFSAVYYRNDIVSPWQLASVYSAFAFLPGLASHLDHTTNPHRHNLIATLEGHQHLFVYTGWRADPLTLTLVNRTPPLKTGSTADDARANADKSASEPDTIYYTTGTARPSQAFVSFDCGQHWLDLTTKHPGEIPPDADFNKLIRNPLNQRQYFLATSQGVYVRDPVTLTWSSFSQGLRLKEDVQDIVINTHNLAVPTLYIATKGRGFWQRAIQ